MKSTSPEIVVVKRNLRWEVSVRGCTRPMIDWLCTKERAVEHALELASELSRAEDRTIHVCVAAADPSLEDIRTVTGDARHVA